MKVRIATRGSALALWQAEFVARSIETWHAGCSTELVVIKTTGDRVTDRPLAEIGGKGLFVKEIQEAVLTDRADIAVHSMKDLPNDERSPLILACVPERADARDVLIISPSISGQSLGDLSHGSRLGTSSLRRACQVRAVRPDIEIVPFRGNLDTRLRKVEEGVVDAAIVAAAGLVRLGWSAKIRAYLSAEAFVPAGAQGALAIETMPDRQDLLQLLAPLHHEPSATRVLAERAFLARMQGSCSAPLGVYAEASGGALTMRAVAGRVSDGTILQVAGTAAGTEGVALGIRLADELIARGAQSFWQ